MSKIFPEHLPSSVLSDPRRSAERMLYEALAKLGDEYCVFYSVAWQSRTNRGAMDGEADFVVVHPDLGLMVIEVKGGGISYDARLRQWYSTDRNGVTHEIKDPSDQARNSHHRLLEKLSDMPKWGSRWLTIGHMVAFPDVHVGRVPLRPDLPPSIILDAASMADLDRALRAGFKYYAGQDPRIGALGHDRLDLVEALLARSFHIKTPLGVELDYEDQRLIELTEQQMLLLDFLAARRRAAIRGCAGSGKTMLAIEKARRLAEEGFEVLLVCFNHALAEDLVRRVADGVSVTHFHGLCREMVNEAGFSLGSLVDEREYYDRVLPDALLQAIDTLGPQFDAIVVDEGQDFHESWWLPLASLLRDADQGILYVFFDDNQNLYHRLSLPPGIVDEPSFPLVENCRNTVEIHKVVATFHHDGQHLRCRGPDGRPVQVRYYRDLIHQRELLGHILQELGEEHVANTDITVLTPRGAERTAFKPGLKLSGYTLVSDEPRHSNQVQVSSIHAFKGLERKVIILMELDGEIYRDVDSLLYVGCSRARTHLIVFADESVSADLKRKLR